MVLSDLKDVTAMDAYIQVIREAFLFFPIIAALLAVPYIL